MNGAREQLFIFDPRNQAFVDGQRHKIPVNRKLIIGLIAAILIPPLMVVIIWNNPKLLYPSSDFNSVLMASIGFTLTLAMIMLVAGIVLISYRLRIHRYTTRGILLDGELVDIRQQRIQSVRPNGGATNDLFVTYKFMSPNSKQPITKSDSRSVPQLLDQLPKVGSPVKVLYVNDKLFRLL
ncbi:MAG TPA: hypothetical protein VKQ72_13200 [Aggregatilineales bacterium]|nr:hypothetical protein [Aggregatilineales bacterium]